MTEPTLSWTPEDQARRLELLKKRLTVDMTDEEWDEYWRLEQKLDDVLRWW